MILNGQSLKTLRRQTHVSVDRGSTKEQDLVRHSFLFDDYRKIGVVAVMALIIPVPPANFEQLVENQGYSVLVMKSRTRVAGRS
jgi:hypothetical protein